MVKWIKTSGLGILFLCLLVNCTKNRGENMGLTDEKKAEITGDLKRIHSVITRALKVTIDGSRAFSLTDSMDSHEIEGFMMYVRCFSSMLRSHHLTEDELAFPYFKKLLPDVPYDTLSAQHKEIVRYLDKIDEWIGKAGKSASLKEEWARLNDDITQIQKIWLPHIRIEENCFSAEKVGPVIGMDERVRLGKIFAEHSRKLQTAGILMVPFILYNLEPADREIMSQSLPWILKKVIVPIILKNKWKPMKPYLL
jgi:hemerythrin-like domain-containing protein